MSKDTKQWKSALPSGTEGINTPYTHMLTDETLVQSKHVLSEDYWHAVGLLVSVVPMIFEWGLQRNTWFLLLMHPGLRSILYLSSQSRSLLIFDMSSLVC